MNVHIFIIVAFIGVTWGQQDIKDTIINNSTNDGGNTNVTSPSLKCGEGSKKNFECVPYYECDSSITQSDGIIDIRPDHESACDRYIDICCPISVNNGNASSTTASAAANTSFKQDNLDIIIHRIYGKNSTNDGGNTNVTSPPLKCGEGSQKNRFECVRYYKCTRSDEVRPNDESACDDYLDVCCPISVNNGTASSTTNSN